MITDEEGDAATVSPMGNLLPVRMLNECAYCPRLFHLMHVEGLWADVESRVFLASKPDLDTPMAPGARAFLHHEINYLRHIR